MKINDSPHPYAIVTIIFWSLAYVLTRVVLQKFSACSFGFLRYFVASCTLVVPALLMKMKIPRIADLKWFLMSGAVGFFFYIIAFNKGSERVTASTSSVVISTVPIMTALFSYFIYHEELKWFQWAAIVIEFLGVIILTLMNGIFTINTGLIWLFFAAIALSTYNLLLRKLLKDYSTLQVSTFSIFAGTLMLTIFLPTSVKEIRNAMPIHLLYILILGIFSSAIAYLAWSKAFSKAKNASTVSNYMFITPFLTTLLGFLISKEIPDCSTIFGGTIILLGLIIFNFGERLYSSKPYT
ncbi:MAG: DMT family transporter [Christensenellaceae bacterium]|jgi:drug/metabolite transporter (DMT)-like permease